MIKKQFYSHLFFTLLFVCILGNYPLAEKIIGGYPVFELVESIPVETNLDNPDIRNTQEVWLEMIQNAKKSIDLEEFYFSNEPNEPLEEVLQAIIDAGNRGITIRIITTPSFYKTYPETVDRLKKGKNIIVRLIDFGKLGGGIMHAKYFIVDKKQVFLGSQNFDWRALKHIHEIGVKIDHEESGKIFSDLFELDWQLAEKNDPQLKNQFLILKKYSVPIKINATPEESLEFIPTYNPTGWIPDESLWDEKHLVDLMDSAKSELIMQVMTYNPAGRNEYYDELDSALRRAAARGVKVKLIIADWSKRKPAIQYLKSLSVIPNIELKMGTIPQYSGGFIPYARVEHCKYLVIDKKKSWIGTSNWEKSYFHTSRNVGVIVENPKIAGLLNQVFQKSWDSPHTYFIKPEIDYEPPKIGE